MRTWWPEAARKADNGWRRGESVSADLGDIRGTPGIVWQCKHVAQLNIAKAWAETVTQAVAAGADYGALVQRRPGHADPGTWWAWISVADVASLLGNVDHIPFTIEGIATLANLAPVRLEVHTLVTLFRLAGYGAPPTSPEEDAR